MVWVLEHSKAGSRNVAPQMLFSQKKKKKKTSQSYIIDIKIWSLIILWQGGTDTIFLKRRVILLILKFRKLHKRWSENSCYAMALACACKGIRFGSIKRTLQTRWEHLIKYHNRNIALQWSEIIAKMFLLSSLINIKS